MSNPDPMSPTPIAVKSRPAQRTNASGQSANGTTRLLPTSQSQELAKSAEHAADHPGAPQRQTAQPDDCKPRQVGCLDWTRDLRKDPAQRAIFKEVQQVPTDNQAAQSARSLDVAVGHEELELAASERRLESLLFGRRRDAAAPDPAQCQWLNRVPELEAKERAAKPDGQAGGRRSAGDRP